MDIRQTPEFDFLQKLEVPRDGIVSDSSGEIQIQIVTRRTTTPASHQSLAIPVDPSFICIGGGAALDLPGPQGAFITASYPSADLTSWNVASKDHLVSNPHNLIGYALGIKINTVTREFLYYYGIYMAQNTAGLGGTSTPTNHPVSVAQLNDAVARITVPLGGGFRVNYGGAGSMVTQSFTNSLNRASWSAAAKDHLSPDPSTITSWILGIIRNPRDLPGYTGKGREIVGFIQEGPQMSTPRYNVNASATLPAGYVLTGGGANLQYSEPGAMLQDLVPNADGVFASQGRDHMEPASSTLIPYALGIKMQVSRTDRASRSPGKRSTKNARRKA